VVKKAAKKTAKVAKKAAKKAAAPKVVKNAAPKQKSEAPRKSFSPASQQCYLKYCNANPDLKGAFCNNKTCTTQSNACRNHWNKYGYKENKKAKPTTCIAALKK